MAKKEQEEEAQEEDGCAELEQRDPGLQEPQERLALQSEEAASGKEHPRVAVLLNNLALALREMHNNRSAEPLFRRGASGH